MGACVIVKRGDLCLLRLSGQGMARWGLGYGALAVAGIISLGFWLGRLLTAQDQGADVTDSDANPTTGKTGAYTFSFGENELTVDAGVWSDPTAVALRTLQATPQSPWQTVLELLRLLAQHTAR
jgi:hypothetical protein